MKKRILSVLLASAILFTTCQTAFAATSDITSHWANQYVTYLAGLGVMNPSIEKDSSGNITQENYKPNQVVTRAEFMRYINRAFGFTEKATISFSDVAATDTAGNATWYYEPIQIAVAHGYINGVGNNKMDPFGNITREQAATIIGRLHKVAPASATTSVTFSDKSAIQSWSLPYIAEAVEAGYLAGYPDGTFKPQGTITRAEFSKMIYNYMGTSLNTANGAYTSSDLRSDVDNVSISKGSTLSNVTVKGDLYITEGVLNDAVTLQNVTVGGKIIVSGGAVTLSGVTASQLVVSTPLSIQPSVTATDASNIGMTQVDSNATLTESNLDISAGGFSDLKITGAKNPTIALNASVWTVTAEGAATITTTSSSAINSLLAQAAVQVTGTGSLQSATLQVKGSTLAMEPTTLVLASGVTATVAGQNVSSSNSVTMSPATFSFDLNSTSGVAYYIDFTMSGDPNEIAKVTSDSATLVPNTDYRATSEGIRIYKAYLTALKEGTHPLYVVLNDGTKGLINIVVADSSKNSIDISSATFNKYKNSLEYANITATLQLAKGVILSSVKLAGNTLEKGSDYTYNASTGVVILQRTMLENKATGSYTVVFTTSAGNSPTIQLSIEDSSPKNEVSPSSIDFDANTASGGYQDLTVSLSAVDGASLTSIKSGGKTLQQDWQYRLSGTSVVLSKTALGDLAAAGASYADLVFVMSSGTNATLRVNFVTTYAVKVTLVDDLSQVVAGNTITLSPTSTTSSATATQTLTTNSEGIATFYVKNGTYTVSASNDKFEQTITRSISVSTGQSVTLTASILETLSLNITNVNGAKLADATVTVGGTSVTTGKDGVATFKIKRGSYAVRVVCTGYKTATSTITVNKTATERIILSV